MFKKQFTERSNKEMLQIIKGELSPTYADRINTQTKESIEESVDAITKDWPMFNEVLNTMFNRIGLELLHDRQEENPLRALKKGTMDFGSTIEEIQMDYARSRVSGFQDLPEGELEREIFGSLDPEVKTAFHSINRQDRYKASTKISAFKQVATNDTLLSGLISATVNTLLNGDALDEYLIMCNLLKQVTDKGWVFHYQTPALTGGNKEQTDALLRKAKGVINTITARPDNKYNPAGITMRAHADELVIFTDATTKADLDVTSLAAAYNLELSNLNQRIFTLPDEDMPDGVDMLITTDKFFVCIDTWEEITTMRNPVGYNINHNLLRQGIYSPSPFAPLIGLGRKETPITAYKPVAKTVDAHFEDASGATVTTAASGDVVRLVVNADDEKFGYTTVLTGNESKRTMLTRQDYLVIAGDESSNKLTVTVKLGDKTKTLDLKLTGEYVDSDTLDRTKRVKKHAE
jgi:hypothetical protein